METVTLAGIVVAVIGSLKELLGDKVNGNITRLVALLIGAGAGYLHLFGTSDWVSGASAGLLAVGVHTVWGK